MLTNFNHGSATIHEFPARVHATAGGHRDETKPAANFTSPQFAKAAFGSSWYHEEAVREAGEPQVAWHPAGDTNSSNQAVTAVGRNRLHLV